MYIGLIDQKGLNKLTLTSVNQISTPASVPAKGLSLVETTPDSLVLIELLIEAGVTAGVTAGATGLITGFVSPAIIIC